MDSSNIDKYAQGFAFIIIEDIASTLSFFSNYPFKNVDADKFLILIKEFLLYDLHVCDRCIFGLFGAEPRKELMDTIIIQIAMRWDEAREKMLDGMLDMLTLNNFTTYLKNLRETLDADGFINEYNQVQVEYSKYSFTKEFDKGLAGQLEWEFGKKIASLAGHKGDSSYILSVLIRAVGFFKLVMETKKVLDENINK